MGSVLCLAAVLYGEARGEGPDGMLAVADVVQARVDDPRWPDTVCEVVAQPGQFVPVWENVREPEAMVTAILISIDSVVLGERLGIEATHFSTGRPPARGLTLVGRLGDHYFWLEE